MQSQIFVSSDLKIRQTKLGEMIKSAGLTNPHPDLLLLEDGEKLGVEAVKKIREHLNLRPYQAKGRVVVVETADQLTTDAQNALLKTLEEPPNQATILLGITNLDQLLPTVLSRCQIIQLDSPPAIVDPELLQQIKKLRSLNMEQRFQFIEKFEDKEQLFTALVTYTQQNLDSKLVDFAQAVLEASQWLAQNVTIRAVLEYLMIRLPQQSK